MRKRRISRGRRRRQLRARNRSRRRRIRRYTVSRGGIRL